MPIGALGQLAMQTAGQVVGAGMGMIAGGINDRRQVRQQEKLQALQIKGQKEMSDYQHQQQKRMWEETNYKAQVEQLQKAGLNPGLMYGMGGGGGTTTGAGTPSVSGASAQQAGGGEITGMAGMGLQNAMNVRLMQEQAELLKAQTEKTKVETTKTAGVDTQESTARIDALMQGVDNARQQHEIQKLEITLKNIENWEKQATQENRLDYIEYQTRQAMKQLQIVENEAYISSKTIQDKITIIAKTAIQAALQNTQTQAQTGKTISDIRVNDQQINNFIQNNMREWDRMTQENRRIAIQQMLGEYHTDPTNTHSIEKIISGIFKMIK